MGFLSGTVFSDTLLRWREPIAYQRLTRSYFASAERALIINFILGLIFVVECVRHARNHLRQPTLDTGTLVFIAFGLVFLIVTALLFPLSSPAVCLMKDGIKKQEGARGGFSWSYYDEIESCRIEHEVYKASEFYVITIKMKDKRRSSLLSPVRQVAAPADVDMGAVTNILHDKGVPVITDESK